MSKRLAGRNSEAKAVKKTKVAGRKPAVALSGWIWEGKPVSHEGREYYNGATFYTENSIPMKITVEDLVATRVEASDEETRELKLTYWIGQVAALFEEKGEQMFTLRFFDQPSQWKYMNGGDGRMVKLWADSFRPGEVLETDVCEVNPLEIILGKVCWESELTDVSKSDDIPKSVFSDRMVIRCGSDGARRADLSDSLWPAPAGRRRQRLLTQYPLARYSLRDEVVEPETEDASYARAVEALKLSVLPENLPCRETETAVIRNFINTAVKAPGQSGNVLYISGVPGAGKTASVLSVVNSLKEKQPLFNFVHINSMKLNTPTDLFSDLIYQMSLGGERGEKSQDFLTKYFSKPKAKNHPVTVLLVDEIDYLVTKSQAVVYQLFDWPLLANSKLVLITISNTMDLPERLMPRVASRLGLARLSYLPYQHEQIRRVLEERMDSANARKVFSTEAITFCSRKVASSNGDIRKALHLCRRAIELRSGSIVSVTDINVAHTDLYTSSFHAVIAHLCYFARLALVALVLCCRVKNDAGAVLRDVYGRFAQIAQTCQPQYKFRATNYSDFLRVVTQLNECGIVQLTKHNPAVTAAKDEAPMLELDEEEQLMSCKPTKVRVTKKATKAVMGKDNGAENDQDGSNLLMSLSMYLESSDVRQALIDEAGDRVAQRYLS